VDDVSIRVNPHLRAAIRRDRGTVAISVRSKEIAQATEGLRRARHDLARLGSDEPLEPDEIPADRLGRVYVGQVVPGPEGPLVWLDGSKIPMKALLTAPSVVERHLRDAGVTNAEITTAEDESLADHQGVSLLGPCLSLRLFPDPPMKSAGRYSPIPAEWIDDAWVWLQGQLTSDMPVTVQTMVPFQVEASAARTLLDDALAARIGEIWILAGDPSVSRSALQGYFGWGQLALSVAGETLSEDRAMVAAADLLKGVARRLAPGLALAYLALEPNLGDQLATFTFSSDDPSMGSSMNISPLVDEVLFDTFPWLVLGPRHIRRLGHVPAGAVELPDGRYELAIGELGDWRPTTPARQARRTLAAASLAPLLVKGRALLDVGRERFDLRGGTA
jgi:hypothetical protein